MILLNFKPLLFYEYSMPQKWQKTSYSVSSQYTFFGIGADTGNDREYIVKINRHHSDGV